MDFGLSDSNQPVRRKSLWSHELVSVNRSRHSSGTLLKNPDLQTLSASVIVLSEKIGWPLLALCNRG